ncbi:unnamed protein product [Protopolystoma xenopodis]|uniref:Uncharacterized protein n=1 Tax=Protopolystoma xenopodis TaxID=117903 RepID=A0A3S5BM64_9PLAT|nr:unnamed protein product [Protopolystoma xenopodis]
MPGNARECPLSDSGNYHAYNGLRNRCYLLLVRPKTYIFSSPYSQFVSSPGLLVNSPTMMLHLGLLPYTMNFVSLTTIGFITFQLEP